MKNLTPPNEDPLIVAETYGSEITIPQTYTEYRDAVVADSGTVTAITYPNQEELETGVAALSALVGIIKAVESVEETARKPKNAWLKTIRKMRDDFLESVRKEHLRITGMVNNYQRKVRDEQEARERKALQDQRDAEEAARKAREAAAAATTEEARLAAQLDAEEAAQNAEEAQAALVVPTNTPKGLTVRERWDFEITNAFLSVANLNNFWKIGTDREEMHFDRKGMLAHLNKDGDAPTLMNALALPPDGENSITHPFGIRIFSDINTSVRPR